MRGVFLSAAGLLVEQTRAATAGRTLHNLETPGFAAETAILHATWSSLRRGDPGGPRGLLVGQSPGLVWSTAALRPREGVIRSTGKPADLALQGEGFFVLAGEEGEVLTRNGSFSLDNEGYLIGAGARRVLGTDGPIRASGGELAVTLTGQVYVGGAQVAQLRLEAAEVGLAPALPGAVYPRPATAEPAGEDLRVQQGALEFSGGDLVGEVTTMMTALRSYEAAQRVTRTHDELTQRLLEKLGNF
ncbi:MAG TPA: hypothetical protein DEQ28_07990 [Clostridiales bacterium]|nr:hypothetical protein [Clostridiales bacterium]